MKYRILKYNEYYFPQYKGWIFWNYFNTDYGEMEDYISFHSIECAKKFIDKQIRMNIDETKISAKEYFKYPSLEKYE